MSGAGNDFILFDAKINPKLELNPALISQFCNRRTGIGADGVLVIEPGNDLDFSLKYFNADGSTGSLCANGARCSLYYAEENGLSSGSNIRFLFNSREYTGRVFPNGSVRFNLFSPTEIKLNFEINVEGQLVKVSFADTGSPHVVVNIDDLFGNYAGSISRYKSLDEFPVVEVGRAIRFHPDFEPNGTNINFVQVEDRKIKIRTYERGVEDETLSCGTGSVASAVILFSNKLVNKPVEILARGGDQLIVDFDFDGQNFNNVSLTGPAKIVFTGEITI